MIVEGPLAAAVATHYILILFNGSNDDTSYTDKYFDALKVTL